MPSANEADYRALEMFVLIKIEIENLSMTVRKQKWAKVSGRPYAISYFFNYRPGSFVLLSKGFRPGVLSRRFVSGRIMSMGAYVLYSNIHGSTASHA